MAAIEEFKEEVKAKSEELVEMAGRQWRKLSNITLLKSKLQRQKALASQVNGYFIIYCFESSLSRMLSTLI